MLSLLLGSFLQVSTAMAAAPDVPTPAPQPANVFLQGEEVRIAIPEAASEQARRWRALDDILLEVRQGTVGNDPEIYLAGLPVGWYRVEFLDENGQCIGFTTAAVLARVSQPPPPDSPVAIDVALSWLADDPDAWPRLSRLATLAGANWVRDRIHWRDMMTGPGEFVDDTKYDATARIQTDSGLKVLQVFHTTPQWALDDSSQDARPRTDLRHLYRFCKAMAERFQGRVHAWEPWNEGNARNFGGRTIDELCAHQKAAYLGFKAGDPGIPVCWGPLGGINTPAQADGILRNETWPYYDVYSIHSYDWPHAYAALWEPARRAACGRPIWVTECDRGMKADPASLVGDYTHEFARRKAEFMAQSYACSLFSGSTRHFHFILGPYMEGDRTVQFGLLRDDYTPRISYVALAALGRFLSGASCLGRWELPDNDDAHVYAFRAVPDGESRDVLVAWVERKTDWPNRGAQTLPWPLPEQPAVDAVFDYLGRFLGTSAPEQLTSAPAFVLLPEGSAETLPLTTVERSPHRSEAPSCIVLQFDTPGTPPVIRQRTWTQEPERVFEPGTTVDCELLVYNFGETDVTGSVFVEHAPEGCEISPDRWEVALPSMDRCLLNLRLEIPAAASPEDAWIVFRGDFGPAEQPSLAFRVHGPEDAERP